MYGLNNGYVISDYKHFTFWVSENRSNQHADAPLTTCKFIVKFNLIKFFAVNSFLLSSDKVHIIYFTIALGSKKKWEKFEEKQEKNLRWICNDSYASLYKRKKHKFIIYIAYISTANVSAALVTYNQIGEKREREQEKTHQQQ